MSKNVEIYVSATELEQLAQINIGEVICLQRTTAIDLELRHSMETDKLEELGETTCRILFQNDTLALFAVCNVLITQEDINFKMLTKPMKLAKVS